MMKLSGEEKGKKKSSPSSSLSKALRVASSRARIVSSLIVLISCLLEVSSGTFSFDWPQVPIILPKTTLDSSSQTSSSSPSFFLKNIFFQRTKYSTFTPTDWCPPDTRQLLEPNCVCHGPESFAILKCANVPDTQSVRRRLSNSRFPITHFGRLVISNSTIPSVDGYSLTGDKSFLVITITRTDTQVINLSGIEGSRLTLKRLEVTHNLLESFPFSNLSRFKKLSHLDLSYNNLKTIPDDAFGHNDQIGFIDLSFNKISHVGSNAFSQLPSLQLLDMTFNRLKVINNFAFASRFPTRNLVLDLTHNKIFFIANDSFSGRVAKELLLDSNYLTKLPEIHFRPLLNEMIMQREGVISVRDNRFGCSCKDTSWLILLPDPYKERIQGFSCSSLESKKGLRDLTLTDIECF